MKRLIVKGISVAMLVAALAFPLASPTFADQSPNGPGQPGAPGTTCQLFTTTPGNAMNGQSPFNPTGQAGNVYAGNPGTASADHSNSPFAVSQYDIACFQQTQH
ncbi:MAG TPA: hypothetical protein VFN02_07760 [Ktedonobacteraceae bacterium]|nr:hypothetical protein [Ktedonobacteraceae bacterium]